MFVERLLWETKAEMVFVDVLLVLGVVQVRGQRDAFIRTTDDRMRRIASGRHPGTDFNPEELERLKARYIARPGKPAKRFELLEQWTPGRRGSNGRPGTPTVYLPTGLNQLLDHETVDAILTECVRSCESIA